MRNLMTFRLFESSVGHNYTFDDIKKLPGYMLLLAVGYYETSTDVMKKHMSMRLYNDELGLSDPNDNVIAYCNGYIRKTTPTWHKDSSQRVMKKFDGDDNLKRWNDQFFYLYEWTLKQYKKKGIISDYKGVHKDDFISGESAMKYMVKSYTRDPASIFSMYDSLDEPNKKKFLQAIKSNQKDFKDEKRKYEFSMNIVKNWVQ